MGEGGGYGGGGGGRRERKIERSGNMCRSVLNSHVSYNDADEGKQVYRMRACGVLVADHNTKSTRE